ncbi:hypothetical protein GNI_015630, partial [Gregarina niphandrodes]
VSSTRCASDTQRYFSLKACAVTSGGHGRRTCRSPSITDAPAADAQGALLSNPQSVSSVSHSDSASTASAAWSRQSAC